MRLRSGLFLLGAMLALAAPAAARAACPPTPATEPLTVNFLGVSTIVLRAGDEAIMVDGFFSRPPAWSMLTIRPNKRRIRRGLDRAGISRDDRGGRTDGARLLALLVAQAHHDHSMDAGDVALLTGAQLVGSPSTRQVALGAVRGLQGIDPVQGGEERCFGPFHVRIIPSPHARGLFTRWLEGEISAPLRPPQTFLAYDDTLNFSFLVTYRGRTILIHPSAAFPGPSPAFPEGGMGGICADIVFLSVGDLGRQTGPQIDAYWNTVVRDVGAASVVPIHWDNFFLGVDFDARRPSRRLTVMPLSGHDEAMDRLQVSARRDGVAIRQLDAYVKVGLDELVAGRTGTCPDR